MNLNFLLSPPIAFVLYLVLVAILTGTAQVLAAPEHATPLKASTYASGETPPARMAAPGYRIFFLIALFFAMLHLGILMIGSSDLSPYAGIYLLGLMLALLALILG